MKFYDSDSEFTFGKYEGKTIKEVFEQDPKYIDFCFNNIDEFYVSPDVMKELRSLDPRFTATSSNEEFDDDLFESYLDEAELVEEIDDPYLDEEEGGNWDDEDDLGLDDDFDSFDDYGDEDDY